jgi:uncharacterized membrane protein
VNLVKRLALWLMAAFYVFAGVMHFVNPNFYLQMMPPYIPWHLAMVYLSGVAELVLGVGLLMPAWRPLAAWGVIALLVAVFPANLHMALYGIRPVGGPAGLENASTFALWMRLPLQGVLIGWAWWYTREE